MLYVVYNITRYSMNEYVSMFTSILYISITRAMDMFIYVFLSTVYRSGLVDLCNF